jgi:hypothetical protein
MAVYRNDLDALASRHAALSDELAAKTQELADAARILEEARAKAKRAVLDNIRVATPCSMDWASMTGDERVRACAACDKNVYNLSGLTREEAEALIVEKEGQLCVRYFQRHDGTILLKDCSIGIAQKKKRRVIAAGAMLLLGGAALFAWKVTRKDAPVADHCNAHEMLGEPAMPVDPTVRGTTHDDPPPPPVVEPVEEIRGQMVRVSDPAPKPMMGGLKMHHDPVVHAQAVDE